MNTQGWENNKVWSIPVKRSICVSGREHGMKNPRIDNRPLTGFVLCAQLWPAAVATWPGFHVHRAGPVNGLYPGRPAIYSAFCMGILGNGKWWIPGRSVTSIWKVSA